MADAPIQGLRISLKLADSDDVEKILTNLNLNINDLDKIRNIADAGVEQSDIRALSGLTVDLDKEVVAIFNETSTYNTVLASLNDGRRIIAGNLNVAGQIIAPSFKFNKVAFDSRKTYPAPFAATGGAGTGATFTVVRRIGTLGYDVTLSAGGTGYVLGNTLTILGTAVDGLAPANNITITVTAVASGVITAFTIPAAGAAGNTTRVYENAIATVDFSTSRSSAWSSFGSPTTSIFYGGDVIINGGTSSIELSSLDFAGPIKAKRFESQLPTHKIRVNIDGANYDLYAMKGIPIRFRGFFRTVNSTIRIDFSPILKPDNQPYRPSWILRNTANGIENPILNRINAGNNTVTRSSIITYYDSTSVERDIEFFYPADRIKVIYLDEVKIYNIPTAKIDSMVDLKIINGDLIEMPDLRPLYPNLKFLTLTNNDLTRSNTIGLRTFSSEVVNRLPLNLETLTLNNNTYGGNCTADLSLLTKLITYNASSGTNSIRRMTGISPAIGPALLNYNVAGNRFTSLHPSVTGSNTLKTLVINSNGIGGTIDATNLNALETFTSGSNSHELFNALNKTNLTSYSSASMSFPATPTPIGTFIFTNCSSLRAINVNSTNITGPLPNFTSNTNLASFDALNTKWLDADENFSIGADTFGPTGADGRAKWISFELRSDNLRKPIEPTAFRGMTFLRTLTVTSSAVKDGTVGIDGSFPTSISDCISLTILNLNNNRLSGELPGSTFSRNTRLSTINLSVNALTGPFPTLRISSLASLNISNNKFTSIGAPFCAVLTSLNASNNLIEDVPNFDNATRILDIFLSNNIGIKYNNNPFGRALSLRRLEMINCGLSQGNINSIISDLYINWTRRQRSGVTINLTGNSPPSASSDITFRISRLRRAGWTIGLDT